MKTESKKVTLIILLFVASFSYAQMKKVQDTRSKLHFGIKAGINYSNVYDEEGQDFVADPKVGFATGAFVSIPLGKFFGIQPEIMFSQKGFKATQGLLITSYEFTRTTNFIDLPLLLQIKPLPMVSVLAGPQFSYLLKTTDKFNNATITQQNEVNSDNYKKGLIGFVIGADFNISHFLISTRAGWDFSQSDSDGNTSSPRYKNQVAQLAIGYIF